MILWNYLNAPSLMYRLSTSLAIPNAKDGAAIVINWFKFLSELTKVTEDERKFV